VRFLGSGRGFSVSRQGSRKNSGALAGCGVVLSLQFQAHDLFVADQIVNEVGLADGPGVAHYANTAHNEPAQAARHEVEGMFAPCVHFALLPVAGFLFLGERMAAGAFSQTWSVTPLAASTCAHGPPL
jgi:hypothetical protein